jgi:polysaccharide biosynthesis/export protein
MISRLWLLLPFAFLALAAAQQPAPSTTAAAANYILGPDDLVTIRVLDIDEVPDKPFRIDMRGNVNLPLVGRTHAAGLTVEEFETQLVEKFGAVLHDPTVSVFINEFRPQPVSVLGSVKTPGVFQIRGTKTLYEVLSLAGGLNPDAGSSIKITRRKSAGPLPLPTAADDSSGEFQVGEVTVKSVMEARNPKENIEVLPDDIVSVPKAELVYVIGAVHRSGGFVLSEKEKMSVLQALSLAEGLDRGAAPKDARILRPVPNTDSRQEIPVNLKEVLAGRSGDVSLAANDILFVPVNGAKTAFGRGLEAAVQMATGVVIYRR